MFSVELKKYEILNEISECGGIVILGSTEDTTIPLGELKQAFAIEEKIYNRSINGLSVMETQRVYDTCVRPLEPTTLFLHIGETDTTFFKEKTEEFVQKYIELITYIKLKNEKCRIVVVSQRNYENHATIAELNRHLKYIADSQGCEYADIANPRVWNPRNTMETVSFVYSLGFVRPLRCKRPLYELVKILFTAVV